MWWAARDPVVRLLPGSLPRPPGLGCRSQSLDQASAGGVRCRTDAAGPWAQRRYGPVLRSLPLLPWPAAASTAQAPAEQKGLERGATATIRALASADGRLPWIERSAQAAQRHGQWRARPCVAVAPAPPVRPLPRAWCWAPRSRSLSRGRQQDREEGSRRSRNACSAARCCRMQKPRLAVNHHELRLCCVRSRYGARPNALVRLDSAPEAPALRRGIRSAPCRWCGRSCRGDAVVEPSQPHALRVPW